MLIAFDANISYRLVTTINASQILFLSKVELIHVERKYGPGIQDITWIEQFSSEGGKAFISADKKVQNMNAGDSCELLVNWKTDDKLDSHFKNL